MKTAVTKRLENYFWLKIKEKVNSGNDLHTASGEYQLFQVTALNIILHITVLLHLVFLQLLIYDYDLQLAHIRKLNLIGK